MADNFYQVFLTFNDHEIQQFFKDEITETNDENFFLDENIDEALADDPLTIMLLVGLLTKETVKVIGSESIKWVFEKLKQIFSKKKPSKNTKAHIPVEVRIDNKLFLFTYDLENGNYTVKELK